MWVSRGRGTAEEALHNQIRGASDSRLGTDKAGLQLAAGYRQDFRSEQQCTKAKIMNHTGSFVKCFVR